MAYTGVHLPLTGAGDATATPAVDLINGQAFQAIKLFDGTEGSTQPLITKATTPSTDDAGLVVRIVPSTANAGAVTILNPTTAVTISNPTSAVDANLTTIGSTRLVGRVDVNNPTTAVSLSSQHTVTVGNPTTAVEANLSTVGSTRLVGRVDVNNPTTAVSLSSQVTITVGNPTTSVTVTSGVVLGAGSSANMLGQVFATGTTKVDVSSGVVLGAGSSANIIGADVISSNSWSSANVLGQVAQGPGSSANAWFTQGWGFSSGSVARTTVNTSVDAAVIAANAARKALVIGSLSTAQICAIGLTTATVTTALANVHLYLQPNQQLVFGFPGTLPLYLGPIRGINISSTAVGGGVAVLEFT